MATQEHTTPAAPEKAETELVAQLLGTDPWMRFDVWSSRAWEATETALRIASESGGAMGDDGMDSRILASFHAAQIAKEFSEMVNPLYAATCGEHSVSLPSESQARAIMSLVIDDDD